MDYILAVCYNTESNVPILENLKVRLWDGASEVDKRIANLVTNIPAESLQPLLKSKTFKKICYYVKANITEPKIFCIIKYLLLKFKN